MQQRFDSSPERAGARGQNDPGVDDEFRVLTTEEGRRLLAEVEGMRSIRPADLARLRKLAAPGVVAAAVRLSMARRKAAEKFGRGDRMWVEATGVEQSTAEPVARHKAARFGPCPLVVDLCAGIGGDAIAMAATSRVLAVDLDPGMCRRILWNATVYDVGDRILAVRARAERFAIPRGGVGPSRPGSPGRPRPSRPRDRGLHARPVVVGVDRPERARRGDQAQPGRRLCATFPGSGYEIELISLRGECKEATVWFGEPASCLRRATRLPEGVTWTDRDAGAPGFAEVSPLSSWIYDPDPSLIRAGLLDGFARAHGLSRIADGVDYLTGPDRVETPFLAAFAVRDVSSMDPKHLRRMIERHRVGTLEIKVRGADVSPEALRARLKPRGEESATLLIVGGASPTRAVLAQRVNQ